MTRPIARRNLRAFAWPISLIASPVMRRGSMPARVALLRVRRKSPSALARLVKRLGVTRPL